MSELIGRTLGRYRIISTLGAGGMGSVYRAVDDELGREVALKVIRDSLDSAEEIIERFRREARILGRLQHPNILPIYDFGQSGGVTYLVTALVSGGTLADQLRNGPMPLPRALRIIDQVAAALDAAHGRGIIHRDLKPQNVLVDESDRVILSDFGIAKLTIETSKQSLTRTGSSLGTPNYMAPEAVLGRPIDQEVDIYALGVMSFEMLAGRPPFIGDSEFSVLAAHIQQEPPSLQSLRSDIPLATSEAIRRALAKDPSARFRTASEFARAAAQGGPEPSQPPAASLSSPPPSVPASRWVLQNPSPRAWLILLLLLLLGTAVILTTWGPARQVGTVPAWVGLAVIAAMLLRPLVLRFLHAKQRVSDPPRLFDAQPVDGQLKPPPWRDDTAPTPATPLTPVPVPPQAPPLVVSQTILESPPSRTSLLAQSGPKDEAASTPADGTRLISAAGLGAPQCPRVPHVRLTFIQSEDPLLSGKVIPVANFPFRIGREGEGLAVHSDPALSRVHCAIEWDNGRFSITDLGSRNGTFVDGHLVPPGGSVNLLFGSVIRLSGSTVLMFNSEEIAELPDLTGQVIDGRFTLIRLIRSSAKTAVYEARDSRLPQMVAVKVLSPSLACYAGYVEQFEREAETAARLRHPHICRVLDHGVAPMKLPSGGTPQVQYLCMEMMAGGSLAQYLTAKELPALEKILGWLEKLTDALDYAHRQGVVHSGLKPTAIVFDQDGEPYVTDFAIASRAGDESRRTFLGAPEFLAPEQWDGLEPTGKVDQYALAVLTYQALTGSRPFEGQADPDVRARNYQRGALAAHEEAARQGRPEFPTAVSEVLRRAMSRDAAERYPTLQDFYVALRYAAAYDRAMPTGKPRIFISYQRDASAGWAVLFARELEEKYGIAAFVDTQRLDSAVRFPARLQRAIMECDVFVCLLAQSTLHSTWVKEEIRLAWQQSKPMVPILQESFAQPEATEELEAHVTGLLDHGGLHLMDRRNIFVDETIAKLAEVVKQTTPRARAASGTQSRTT